MMATYPACLARVIQSCETGARAATQFFHTYVHGYVCTYVRAELALRARPPEQIVGVDRT